MRDRLLNLSKCQTAIDPEDVIAWLVTQPNANGTLYLKNVVRQYMSVLRTAPAKLDIPAVKNIRNVFVCRTPDDLNAYWEVFKAAPNYKQVNKRAAGKLSAALQCYMRYLQHLSATNQVDGQGNEPMNYHGTNPIQNERPTNATRCVDFQNPDQYKGTIPISCTIHGVSLKTHQKPSWKRLLAAITAHFICENNPAMRELQTRPLYVQTQNGQERCSAPFLSPQKIYDKSMWIEYGNVSGWVNVGFGVTTLIRIIQLLCERCGIATHNVHIECMRENDTTIDAVFITRILSERFSNGYRLNSPIERARFRSFAAEDWGKPLALSDAELETIIAACGTNYAGKIYTVTSETKQRIKKLIEGYFASGAQAIFFAAFYAQNENWLFGASVVSEDMLVGILRELFPTLSFTQTYFGHTNATVAAVLKSEILRVWGADVLLTYDQLAARLPYVPLERIKNALAQNGEFIWNNAETFTHISRVAIADAERETILAAAGRECNAHGYVSIAELPFGEIAEHNHELSITAIHSAVYFICLSDTFTKKGRIIARHGDEIDALTIVKEYCRTIDKCALNDLLGYVKELVGEVHRWIPMEAGNTILVRTDKDAYVADRYVHFDADLIDAAIELLVKEDYLPLKSFTTFGVFPDCGQTWNLFLLESYCRRFSRKFRFDAASTNSRNAGAVIRKSCDMSYTEIMTDAVANANIPLKDVDVGRFLFDNGYIGRSTTTKSAEIIEKAKAIRERRD